MTLAPVALRAWNRRQQVARAAYETTVADAARPEGCDLCCQALWPDDGAGWLRRAGLLFCRRCRGFSPTRRMLAAALAERVSS